MVRLTIKIPMTACSHQTLFLHIPSQLLILDASRCPRRHLDVRGALEGFQKIKCTVQLSWTVVSDGFNVSIENVTGFLRRAFGNTNYFKRLSHNVCHDRVFILQDAVVSCQSWATGAFDRGMLFGTNYFRVVK